MSTSAHSAGAEREGGWCLPGCHNTGVCCHKPPEDVPHLFGKVNPTLKPQSPPLGSPPLEKLLEKTPYLY